jgi:hypothetical protein
VKYRSKNKPHPNAHEIPVNSYLFAFLLANPMAGLHDGWYLSGVRRRGREQGNEIYCSIFSNLKFPDNANPSSNLSPRDSAASHPWLTH